MRNRSRAVPVLAGVSLLLLFGACGGGSDQAGPTATMGSAASEPPTDVDLSATQSTSRLGPTGTTDLRPPETPNQSSTVGAAAVVPSLTPVVYPTRGGSARFDSDQDDSLTWDEYTRAVTAAFEAFPWPPTYIVTPELILAAWPADAHEATFQPGFELNNISLWADCAWEMTWLDSRQSGDSQLEAEALNYIVTSLPTGANDDYSRSVEAAIGERAALGDPSEVIQAVQANCPILNIQKAAP